MGQGVAGPAQRSAEHPRPGLPPSAVSSPPPLRAAPAARSRAQPGRHRQEERDGRQPPRPARTAARSPSPRRPPPPGPPVRQRARPAAAPGAGSPGRARPAADWEVVTRTPGPASRAGPPAPAARGPSPGLAHRRPEPAAVPADQPRRGEGPPVGWRKLARSEVREVGPGGVSALRGRFLPLFHPGICCLVCGVGSRQEMAFSPVRRRAMRSVMAMWIMASERTDRVS